jgi:hypothetical protein
MTPRQKPSNTPEAARALRAFQTAVTRLLAAGVSGAAVQECCAAIVERHREHELEPGARLLADRGARILAEHIGQLEAFTERFAAARDMAIESITFVPPESPEPPPPAKRASARRGQ